MNYVLGFPYWFINNNWEPLLLRKTNQNNLLNGFGGKIESGEDASQAIIREFQEESNLPDWVCNQINWDNVGEIQGSNYHITVFQSFNLMEIFDQLPSLNKEGVVDLLYLNKIKQDDCMDLVFWFLLNKDTLSSNKVHINYSNGIPKFKLFKRMV